MYIMACEGNGFVILCHDNLSQIYITISGSNRLFYFHGICAKAVFEITWM